MNDCKFTGRFTAKPRRMDSNNISRCYFTLMVNKEGKRQDGTKYPAQPVDFVAWGKTADLICQYKDKGHLVLVTSEFSTYERDAVDMNNQVIPNARKIQRPIFTVRTIEFMPVSGGANSGNQQYNNSNEVNDNLNNEAMMDEFNFTNNNPVDVSQNNVGGEVGFEPFLEEDPFKIGTLP